MQLKVHVWTPGRPGSVNGETISTLDDAEKIGTRAGRWVRDFLRNVPMRRAGARMQIFVDASWVEREPRANGEGKPRRRRKKGKSNGAAE
jgi:hypothetical protein